jgi:hypothetical protein
MTTDPFPWPEKSKPAAELLANGRLTLNQIAERLDVDPKTLWNWRQHPEFAAKVEEHLAEFRAKVRREGIAVLENRVASLNDRWGRLLQIVEARAADPDMKDVVAGETGLLKKTVRFKGVGDDNIEKTVEVELDVPLLRELREHEKQAAQELGQWVVKSQVESTVKAYVTLSPEDL